jgi:ATP-dependent DNA ligase
VLDGELVALRDGRLDSGALTSSPKVRGHAGVTIYYVAFDLPGVGGTDLRGEPYVLRRSEPAARLAGVRPPVQLVPSTTGLAEAMQWMRAAAATLGVEGIVAKDTTRP